MPNTANTPRPDRLPNGLEEELIDLHAVEAEFQDVEGLRDALTIIRRSPEWATPRAVNAVGELINQIHDAVSRVRFALDGHPEPHDEKHPAVISMSRLNAEAIAVLPGDERDWLAEECKRVLSIVTGDGEESTGEGERADASLAREAKAAAGMRDLTREDVAAMSPHGLRVLGSHCQRILTLVATAEAENATWKGNLDNITHEQFVAMTEDERRTAIGKCQRLIKAFELPAGGGAS